MLKFINTKLKTFLTNELVSKIDVEKWCFSSWSTIFRESEKYRIRIGANCSISFLKFENFSWMHRTIWSWSGGFCGRRLYKWFLLYLFFIQNTFSVFENLLQIWDDYSVDFEMNIYSCRNKSGFDVDAHCTWEIFVTTKKKLFNLWFNYNTSTVELIK